MIYPVSRTVPLAKDLASSSTFTLAIGVSTPRTDLDTILAAIDQAIANEVTARQAATAASNTSLSNHITSSTAHPATAITVVASGNQTGTNAQTAINVLQTEIDLKASITSVSAEISSRTAAGTILQNEIDGERSPMRLSVTGANTAVSIGSSVQTRIDLTGAASGSLGVPSGSFQSTFAGATVDFNLGLISYSGGTPTTSSFTVAPLSGNANQFTKYSIVLLPTAPDTLLVVWGGTFASTAAAVSSPAFSGGVPVGIVSVQVNSGATGISNVLQSNLTQFFAGGGGSGSGSGSPLDPQSDETFVFYTRSDFSVDKQKFVGSTTGVDSTLGLGKISLAATQTFTSKDLTGTQIKSDAAIINTVQGRLMYNTGKIDTAPTVQFSRDGGATYVTATVSLPGSVSNIIEADLTFTDTTPLFNGGTANGTLSSGVQVAAMFTPSYNMVLTSFAMFVRTTATVGTVTPQLYSVASGTPNAVLSTSGTVFVAGQDITSIGAYATGSFTPISLTAGTQYALVLAGASLNANLSVDQVTSAPAFSTGSSTNNGSGYAASALNLAYQVNGAGADLRMKVTASATSELAGFGVNYVIYSQSALSGIASYEQRSITSTEASTGNITLSAVNYTPGAHQLFALHNGHTFFAPDFIETSPSTVAFGAGFFQKGDVVSFYNGYGIVDGSSQSLSKINSIYDAIVGSSAQQASGVAAYSSLQSAINAFPNGMILVLKGYNTVENITIASNNFLIEGQGYQSQINGTLTLTSTVNFGAFKNLRFVGNVSIAANGCFIRDCYLAPTFSVTDTGTANSKLIIGE